MKNVKAIRKTNAKFLAQLLVDKKFYAQKLGYYDENGLREKVAGLKKKRDDELQRVNGLIGVEKRKDRRPTQEDLKKFVKLDKAVKEVEMTVNEYEGLKEGEEKGRKAIENVSKMLGIIDNLSGKERKEINSL